MKSSVHYVNMMSCSDSVLRGSLVYRRSGVATPVPVSVLMIALFFCSAYCEEEQYFEWMTLCAACLRCHQLVAC